MLGGLELEQLARAGDDAREELGLLVARRAALGAGDELVEGWVVGEEDGRGNEGPEVEVDG